MKRRAFLKGTIAAGLAGSVAVLTPSAIAKWNKETMEAKGLEDTMKAMGVEGAEESKDIEIKAPEIAENGMVVPITVESKIEGTESISILVAENGTPLSAVFNMSEGAIPAVKTRVKMGKTSDVVAVVKAGDKYYKNHVAVKVTKGGCGG